MVFKNLRIVFLIFLLFAELDVHSLDGKTKFDHVVPALTSEVNIGERRNMKSYRSLVAFQGGDVLAHLGWAWLHEGLRESASCLDDLSHLITCRCSELLSRPWRPWRLQPRYGLGAVGFCMMITCLAIQWSMMLESILKQTVSTISFDSLTCLGMCNALSFSRSCCGFNPVLA